MVSFASQLEGTVHHSRKSQQQQELSFFSHYCDHTPVKKQLQEGNKLFWLTVTVKQINSSEVSQQQETSQSHLIQNHEAENEQEMDCTKKISRLALQKLTSSREAPPSKGSTTLPVPPYGDQVNTCDYRGIFHFQTITQLVHTPNTK